jgi:pimeloyl-ACP methyl ester carboxylesterase
MDATAATLHDGTTIAVHVAGRGPAIVLPVRSTVREPGVAETMRAWGADPDLGPGLIRVLARDHQVIAADYEAHRMAHPAPWSLTPDVLAVDVLAIADAAGIDRFAWYGYSWLGLTGFQVALRTDRLTALAMGGFPPLGGPYRPMLAVTRAAHAWSLEPRPEQPGTAPEPGDWSSVSVQTTPDQTQQFVTLYEALQDFDEASAVRMIRVPRLVVAGADDDIAYGPGWGDTLVRIGGALADHAAELRSLGWTVHVLPGLDHLGAMHADVVLPRLRSWLGEHGC